MSVFFFFEAAHQRNRLRWAFTSHILQKGVKYPTPYSSCLWKQAAARHEHALVHTRDVHGAYIDRMEVAHRDALETMLETSLALEQMAIEAAEVGR